MPLALHCRRLSEPTEAAVPLGLQYQHARSCIGHQGGGTSTPGHSNPGEATWQGLQRHAGRPGSEPPVQHLAAKQSWHQCQQVAAAAHVAYSRWQPPGMIQPGHRAWLPVVHAVDMSLFQYCSEGYREPLRGKPQGCSKAATPTISSHACVCTRCSNHNSNILVSLDRVLSPLTTSLIDAQGCQEQAGKLWQLIA
jgi:hypothetical protein